jgi:hypothetical protein
MRAIALLQAAAIKKAEADNEEMFLGIPDNWYEPRPNYGCDNGHVSIAYLKTEEQGNLCLVCHLPVAIIPHGYTDETLAKALDEIRAALTNPDAEAKE